VSGHGDSIRKRRAQEIRRWEEDNGLETAKTTQTPLAYIVAAKFVDVGEQIVVLEKLLQGRLTLEYLEWNGKTTTDLRLH